MKKLMMLLMVAVLSIGVGVVFATEVTVDKDPILGLEKNDPMPDFLTNTDFVGERPLRIGNIFAWQKAYINKQVRMLYVVSCGLDVDANGVPVFGGSPPFVVAVTQFDKEGKPEATVFIYDCDFMRDSTCVPDGLVDKIVVYQYEE